MGPSFYASVDEFTAELAASLIAGPRLAPANQQHYIDAVLQRLKTAYQHAVDYYKGTGPLPGAVQSQEAARDGVGLSSGAIRCCHMEHGEWLLAKDPANSMLTAWLANCMNLPTEFEQQTFSKTELQRWLHAVGMPSNYDFAPPKEFAEPGHGYVSLEKLTESTIHLSMNELPEEVRERVEMADSFSQWDRLSPDERRSLLRQLDSQHDPAMKPENDYWFALSEAIGKAESTKREYELRHPQSITELKVKQDMLAALDARLRNLAKLGTLPPFVVKDWDALSDDTLTGLIVRNTSQEDTACQAAREVDSGASDAPADGPQPLATGDIAWCFAELRQWNEQRWKKELGSPDVWLKDCQQTPGERGKGRPQSTWWPIKIGAALVNKFGVRRESVRARFQSRPHLQPWLDAWKTYEADHLETQ